MSKLILTEGKQVKDLESGEVGELMIGDPFIDIRTPIDISFYLHNKDDIAEIRELFDGKSVEWFTLEFPEYFL
ncbi:hypothetical protein [Vibrio sp. 1727]|uniref:hypothetical protein n=1 Tax=Vibrio sp. 1727 TaxID=3074572 RepID=UPI002806C56F|nr:hypothetical protein [Vibrio sp. 1727]ELA6659779.1 hypothetical protein [Vibrio alginolyticus]MDW3111689.1 hypothetical protein [Vibrio sp. 1727]HCZ9282704.1 hypothetical protein [Vibrio alginolyticus]HCZ9395904.1 hypothetical protein [Vibrio alginolyticus]